MSTVSAQEIDVLEHLPSVLLAVALAQWAGLANVDWAAFAGFMVMRCHIRNTLLRGTLRVLGTVADGTLAWAAIPLLVRSWPLQAASLFVVGSLCLYGAIVSRRAYSWLFAGLTFAMVLFDALERPNLSVGGFVRTRVLETLAGTASCIAVGIVTVVTLRRIWPAFARAAPADAAVAPHAARHAAQGGVALALLAVLAAFVDLPGRAQAPITIMVVMLLPADGIGPSGLVAVSRRIGHRVAGCVAGALLAGFTLLLAQGSAPVFIAGTAAGVATGRLNEMGQHARRYVGTQFVLAVLVTLVPDSYASAHMTPAWDRLFGILLGMAILEPVLLGWHYARVRRVRAAD